MSKPSPATKRERSRCARLAEQAATFYRDLAEKSHEKGHMDHWSACLARAAVCREVAGYIRRGCRPARPMMRTNKDKEGGR